MISVNSPSHNRPGSVGRVLPNLEVRLEHWDTGEACPTGVIGKILVKGPSVMNGYFDDFEATSMRLHRGWYDTQDMGYMDVDGYLWHVGRLARFLKIGGEMVSLPLVEDILQRALPPGVDGVVVEAPDATRGSRVVAVVTEGVDEREVLRQMGGDLPNDRAAETVRGRPGAAEDAERQDRLPQSHRGRARPRPPSVRVRPAGDGAHRATTIAVMSSTCSVPIVARMRRR